MLSRTIKPGNHGKSRLPYGKLLALLSFMVLLWLVMVGLYNYYNFSELFKHDKVVTSLDITDLLQGAFVKDLVYFAAAYLAVHLLLAVLFWLTATTIAARTRLKPDHYVLLGFVAFIAGLFWLVGYNAYHFPFTLLGSKYAAWFAASTGSTLHRGSGWLLLGFFGLGLYHMLILAGGILRRNAGVSLAATTAIFLMTVFAVDSFLPTTGVAHGHRPPDVIIVGIDSLRPDHVAFLEGGPIIAPNVEHFLRNSVSFSDAVTPLARTFPSWMSILTGKHPKNHGARFSLTPPELVDRENTLAWHFHARGYTTLFALDERRFANIDESYGFDRVIGSRAGAGDFVFGGAIDNPVTNFVVNSALGRILFPFNHANRAADVTYLPETFDTFLEREIEQLSPTTPMFLAVHFCLPHWPFTWADSETHYDAGLDPNSTDPDDPYAAHKFRYKQAVARADQQFGRLMRILQRNGRLDNAIVVFVSDHGDAQGEQPLYSHATMQGKREGELGGLQKIIKKTSFGHGTSVLGRQQYQVVLGFAGYGELATQPRKLAQPAGLIDIAPTLLDLMDQPSALEADGLSLAPLILGQTDTLPEREFFLESGFTMPAIDTLDIKLQKVFQQGFHYYRVNPESGRAEMRRESIRSLLETKQRAVVRGEWIVLRYVQDDAFRFALFNRDSGAWTIDMHSELAQSASAGELIDKLQGFYGRDGTTVDAIPPMAVIVPEGAPQPPL